MIEIQSTSLIILVTLKLGGDLDSFYLVDEVGEYTNSGGLLMFEGGTVTNSTFNDITADWMCKLMGYGYAMRWNSGNRHGFQDKLQIKVDNLRCTNSVLPSCYYDTFTSGNSHDQDVWLWCAVRSTIICPPGHRIVDEECEECPPSTYSPKPNENTTCLPCPERSASLAGATQCICPGGTFFSFELSSCESCPDGTVGNEGISSISQCVACPPISSPSDDKTHCLIKSESSTYSIVSIGLASFCLISIMVLVAIFVIWSKRKSKKEASVSFPVQLEELNSCEAADTRVVGETPIYDNLAI